MQSFTDDIKTVTAIINGESATWEALRARLSGMVVAWKVDEADKEAAIDDMLWHCAKKYKPVAPFLSFCFLSLTNRLKSIYKKQKAITDDEWPRDIYGRVIELDNATLKTLPDITCGREARDVIESLDTKLDARHLAIFYALSEGESCAEIGRRMVLSRERIRQLKAEIEAIYRRCL